MKLELVAVPVSDVDRAKAFYTEKAGFNADHDHTVNPELRFVQLTPPGSACSVFFGAELTERGLDAGEIADLEWGSFIYFRDPDGNQWAIQQLVPREGR